MPHKETELVRARLKDIKLIAELATTVWNQHYRSIISDEQIEYMLNMMYSAGSLEKQFKDNHEFFLIQSNGEIIGFISVNEKEDKKYFLHKFYLLQNKARKGQGTCAFKELLKLISPKEIQLTVNRQNFKSINFYFKNGFIIKHSEVFNIGNNFAMDDFVMEWRLDKQV